MATTPVLKKYAAPLRGVGPGGIPVAAPDGIRLHGATLAVHYSLTLEQYADQLHPALGPTTLWGYHPDTPVRGGRQPNRHLGGIIVAWRGLPVQLTVTNALPPTHLLPVDVSVDFPDAAARFGGSGHNAATTHLHGGFVPWISDGNPMTWFTPTGTYGPSTAAGASGNIYTTLDPFLHPGQAAYYYPNHQSARMLWYHDHAHDLTRLNVYAGLASVYLLRDAFELSLCAKGLPTFMEFDLLTRRPARELPIVIQDKVFVGPDIATTDPSWPGPTSVGSLWYPHVAPPPAAPPPLPPPPQPPVPHPSVVPEMFGDTMLANGTVYPVATVEARRYRLRVLNACQARFLNLQLYVDDGSPDGITLDAALHPTNAAGPAFLVLGTEGGFLPQAVSVPANQPFDSVTFSGSLITAPAERWDLLVDFTGYAGRRVILYNDAPAPFPTPNQDNDYFPGSPATTTPTPAGSGPDTRQIMAFDVVPARGQDAPSAITAGYDLTAGLDPFLVPPGTSVQAGEVQLPSGVPVRHPDPQRGQGRVLAPPPAARHRRLHRRGCGRAPVRPAVHGPAGHRDPGGRHHGGLADPQSHCRYAPDSLPPGQRAGTGPAPLQPGRLPDADGAGRHDRDAHLHRPARGPDPTELGWKETVRMNPAEVTWVIMRFDLPSVPFTVPASPRTGGHEYVWHCHILEHEEHDMMRPLVIP